MAHGPVLGPGPVDNVFTGMFKKPNKNSEAKSADEDSLEDNLLSASCENLSEGSKTKEKAGGFAGMFKKSPKPAKRSVTDEDPLRDAQFEFGSCDSLPDMIPEENLSATNEELIAKEKKSGFAGLFKRTPKIVEPQDGEDEPPANGLGIKRRRTIKKQKRVVSFRVKKTLPRLPKPGGNKMAAINESVEMEELISEQEGDVEVEQLEMAAYPTIENSAEAQEEDDELMEWWRSVVGWVEWNETSNQEENEEEVMEEAADRVYMGARLFVQLFNQRGASLQHKILELLALADAADLFHKKTTAAAVGGGVASVAGSVATITGLILAPFTFGASIIVTAVGIGVATAGSITSATANITDSVHANMDRKNMEKMIQSYQEEIKDISECLEFVQEGIDTLQEWDFEKFTESAAKKAMNHNIKHVVKEGGRAGKALMINTDKLISTVRSSGQQGALLKLYLPYLPPPESSKDSHELRKGAKTKFAAKLREVCKDLQDGLLELNKVKTQLQKTMDGIEVEEYEEIQEVEEEVEDDLESDPVKLAELEHELDLMEEKLDQKVEEERKRKEEEERKKLEEEERKRREEEEAIAAKEKLIEEAENEDQDENVKLKKSDEEKSEGVYSVKESLKEFFKDPILKVNKKDKDLENKITADKEKGEKEKSIFGKKTHKKALVCLRKSCWMNWKKGKANSKKIRCPKVDEDKPKQELTAEVDTKEKEWWIFGKKTHKKAASLSEKELLDEMEKSEKENSKKEEDKVKAKSQKIHLSSKLDIKTEEKTTSDDKISQDVAKVDEDKPKQELTAKVETKEKEWWIFGKKTHKKAASLSEKELLDEMEKSEKGKSKKQEDKVKAKSQKVARTTKQDAKTNEKTPSDGKNPQDDAKIDEDKPKQELTTKADAKAKDDATKVKKNPISKACGKLGWQNRKMRRRRVIPKA
ncbi:hypothetical protein WMY93_000716 [Mugilogobius chulae]|uniref:Apolipoprotein L6 n=1 Tax=Mugilogobius chulae TaxID=88201 RepID=A0AAW0Q8B3_9GOBI